MSEPVTIVQEKDYRFANTFGEGIPVLHADEAPPLGGGTGPTPVQLFAASVGNCLSASLLFALRKFKNNPEPIRTHVEAQVGRNEQKRLRVLRIKVRLDLGIAAEALAHADHALAQFEDFCTVTASVRQSTPVDVEVFDSAGRRLK